MKSHAAVAAVLLERERDGRGRRVWRESLVEGVLRDLESSALPEKEKALLRFVDQVNHDSPRIGPRICDRCAQAGWSDEAIYYAITVCALFNFYNRWIDASRRARPLG